MSGVNLNGDPVGGDELDHAFSFCVMVLGTRSSGSGVGTAELPAVDIACHFEHVSVFECRDFNVV